MADRQVPEGWPEDVAYPEFTPIDAATYTTTLPHDLVVERSRALWRINRVVLASAKGAPGEVLGTTIQGVVADLVRVAFEAGKAAR